jgi:putative hemolysin
MDYLLIALLTLLNGVFAMSELALASSRKARLLAMAEAGDGGASAALRLLEHPTRFLSTVQVGITSIGVLNGIVGEAAFSDKLAHWLHGFGIAERPSAIAATALVVTAITFVTIIFGPSGSASSIRSRSRSGCRGRWHGWRGRRARS